MDRTTADINDIRIPGEGDAIATALVALDERLTAWATAMREACRQVADAASTRRPIVAEEPLATATLEAPAPAADMASGLDPAQPVGVEPTAISSGTVKLDAEPASPLEVSSQVASAEEQAAPKESPSEADSTTSQTMLTEQMSVAAPEPANVVSAAEQDEALLASLDPEAAKAIKVMRRLSPDRKSVKELLAEYEANRSAQPPAAQPKKKSWFSRG